MDEVIGDIGAAGRGADKTETALPYSDTILLTPEAIGRSGHSGVTKEDVKLFVRDRLADMRKFLEGLSNTANTSGRGNPSDGCLEERRMRSVVFHGDVFHKPTPRYSWATEETGFGDRAGGDGGVF